MKRLICLVIIVSFMMSVPIMGTTNVKDVKKSKSMPVKKPMIKTVIPKFTSKPTLKPKVNDNVKASEKNTQANINIEEKAVKAAHITIKSIEKAKQDREYIDHLNFGSFNDEDSLFVKYLGTKAERKAGILKGKLIYGLNGERELNTILDADRLIRSIFVVKKIGLFSSEDEKTNYYCIPDIYFKDITKYGNEFNHSFDNGLRYTYVLTICEIGYDNSKKLYYIKACKDKDFKNGKLQIKEKYRGSIEKYIAIPRLIIEPANK